MNLATRAALFNVLLFPGWGQIYLKKYTRGVLIILGIVSCLFSIAWLIIQETINILKMEPLRKGIFNFGAFLQLAIDAIKKINLFYLLLILTFMILLWIFSIIDAYLLGEKVMTKTTAFSDQQTGPIES